MSRHTTPIDKNWLIEKIQNNDSIRKMSRDAGCSFGKIDKAIEDYNLRELLNKTKAEFEQQRFCVECRTREELRLYNGIYYCEKHYKHMTKHGKIVKTVIDPNEFIVEGNIVKIVTVDRECNSTGFGIIDYCTFDDFIKSNKWGLRGDGYISTKINTKTILLHKYIYNKYIDANYKGRLDHINGSGFDNRVCNLRPVTNQENAFNSKLNSRNTTGYKGVSYDKERNKYESNIGYNYKKISLGYFDTAEEAYEIRIKKELELFGEYSRLHSDKSLWINDGI